MSNQNLASPQAEEAIGTHNGSNGTVESAELLRWRADMLLDEMLLGGAEIGAGHHKNGTHLNGHHTNGAYPNGTYSATHNGNHDLTNTNGATYANGPVNQGSLGPHQVASPSSAQTDQVNLPQPSPETTGRAPNQPVAPQSSVNSFQEKTSSVPAQPLLVSAEQRYARSVQPTSPPVADPNQSVFSSATTDEPGEQSAGLGPVRRSTTAGAMSVANRGSKYSTLLPRESSPDPESLLREIISLGNQIATDIPAAHESRERAQKLLDKANTILQSDPLRSAEVGYYLQQVRSMIDRLRQNLSYSALYQRRLHTYLFAWLALALVTIVGCILYGKNLVDLLMMIANVDSDSLLSQHLVALLLTLFAGGLGGALGALWSMRNQAKQEFFFLDRKFSLRSMILPVTGFVAGILVYFLLGLIYWGFGLDPSHNLAIAFIPMLLTFGVAWSQEIVFGVRS
ncbi:MAG: hypothetical protein U0175_15710 [Caldilineaceae bacterium]